MIKDLLGILALIFAFGVLDFTCRNYGRLQVAADRYLEQTLPKAPDLGAK